ncbi:MAG: amidohydrolase [Candidatus Hodarchaeales archaeon]
MVSETYDWTLFGDNIYTMEIKPSKVDMLVVKNDRIVYTGEFKEKYLKNTTVSTDLGERALIPGFIDLHTHLWKESSVFSIDLGATGSYQEAINMIKQAISEKREGEWLFATNWDESKWDDQKRFFSKEDLNKVGPKNPIYAIREDGHLVVVNDLAMAEIKLPKDHAGVEKDDNGEPTGVLKDVWLDTLQFYENQIPNSILKAIDFAASKGVTSVVDNLTIIPDSQEKIIKSYFRLNLEGKLTLRIFLNPTRMLIQEFYKLGLVQNCGSSFVRFSGFKGFYDGALGSQTALLSVEYNDVKTKGEKFVNEEELISQICFAEKNGMTLCIHAIGDQAIEELLDCFEKGIKKAGNITSLRRHRIEHAEYITDKQIRRANDLGIILSMQPNFLKWEYPGGLYEQRLGKDRFMDLNRFSRILDMGAHLSFGSDNMPLDPMMGIRHAVTFPSSEIRISLMDAFKAYTINNAHALFMEDLLGSLKLGKYADFVILSRDPFQVDAKYLNSDIIEKTVVAGRTIYDTCEKE